MMDKFSFKIKVACIVCAAKNGEEDQRIFILIPNIQTHAWWGFHISLQISYSLLLLCKLSTPSEQNSNFITYFTTRRESDVSLLKNII